MSLSDFFVHRAKNLIGLDIAASEFIDRVLYLLSQTPEDGTERLREGTRLRVGDIAVRRGHAACYVGNRKWIESGTPVHYTSTSMLKRQHAVFERTKAVLEEPSIVTDEGLFYWVVVCAEGPKANKVIRYAKEMKVATTFKRTNRAWANERLIHGVQPSLPE